MVVGVVETLITLKRFQLKRIGLGYCISLLVYTITQPVIFTSLPYTTRAGVSNCSSSIIQYYLFEEIVPISLGQLLTIFDVRFICYWVQPNFYIMRNSSFIIVNSSIETNRFGIAQISIYYYFIK